MTRRCLWLVLLVACTDKRVPTATATSTQPSAVTATGEREMTIIVDQCLPVGYGEHCGGTIDGRAVSLQACVGRDGTPGLMSLLEGAPIAGQDGGRPVTIGLRTKYIGVLDAAYSTDYCGGLLFEGSKERFHVVSITSGDR